MRSDFKRDGLQPGAFSIIPLQDYPIFEYYSGMRKTPGNPRTFRKGRSAKDAISVRLGALRIAAPASQSYVELRNCIHMFLGCRRLGHRGEARRIFQETYLQLVGRAPARGDEAHFPLLVANLLRQLLTAQSRTKQPLPVEGGSPGDVTVVDIDAALTVLETRDPLSARLIELHYFAGVEAGELAAILVLEPAIVIRRLRAARAWLAAHLVAK